MNFFFFCRPKFVCTKFVCCIFKSLYLPGRLGNQLSSVASMISFSGRSHLICHPKVFYLESVWFSERYGMKAVVTRSQVKDLWNQNGYEKLWNWNQNDKSNEKMKMLPRKPSCPSILNARDLGYRSAANQKPLLAVGNIIQYRAVVEKACESIMSPLNGDPQLIFHNVALGFAAIRQNWQIGPR